jgi:hypothetical protein
MKSASPPLLLSVLCFSILAASNDHTIAQARRPTGGPIAVVVDERLAALRRSPHLSGKLIQRLSRGRFVAIRRAVRISEGVTFYHVRVTRRRSGWLQLEAVVSPSRVGDDRRLYRLLLASEDFDLIVRSRIFLDTFPRSSLRPAVLKLFAAAADAAAEKLSLEASRRLNQKEVIGGGGPEFSYYLNYSGLDRYNRQGIRFGFDHQSKKLRYDGAAWREIIRRYPKAIEAQEARRRMLTLSTGRVE